MLIRKSIYTSRSPKHKPRHRTAAYFLVLILVITVVVLTSIGLWEKVFHAEPAPQAEVAH